MTDPDLEQRTTTHPNRRALVALVPIIILGAALRLYHLGYYSLWYDECASLFLAQFADLNGSLFDFHINTEPPMMAILARLWYAFVQTVADFPVTSQASDYAIRFLPFVFGTSLVPLAFFLARALFKNTRIALAAAYLIAINPFQIYYAQELRIYSFLAMLALLAILNTYKALETGQRRYWIAFVLIEALMMYSHFITVWFIFSMNVWFVAVLWRYKQHFWRWVLANAILMLLITPSLIMAWRMSSMVAELWPPWYPKPTWKTGLISFKSLLAWFGPNPRVYWPLVALALMLMLVGLGARRKQAPAALLIVILSALPIAANVVVWNLHNFSFYEHRLFIISGLAAIIAAGCGIAALRPALAVPALIVYTALSALAMKDMYHDNIHPAGMHRLAMWNKVDVRAAARFIESNREDSDAVVIGSHFLYYPLWHYLETPAVHVGIDETDAKRFARHLGNPLLLERHGLLPTPIPEVTAQHQRIWFLRTYGTTFEHRPDVEKVLRWLQEHCTEVSFNEFVGVHIYQFDCAPDAP